MKIFAFPALITTVIVVSAPLFAEPAPSKPSETTTLPKATTPPKEFALWLGKQRVVVPAGTPVKLKIEEQLKGNDVKMGDSIPFTIMEDVQVGGTTVFKKDAKAQGVVTFAQGAKNWGKGSRFEFDILWATAADGRHIPTFKHIAKKVKNEDITKVMTFGILSPFTKGGNAKVKKGTEYDVEVGEKPLEAEATATPTASPTPQSKPLENK